jgi:hypothetical protein
MKRKNKSHKARPGHHHHTSLKLRVGGARLSADIGIGTDGLLAVAALVGVILAGSAGIVWVATSPTRRVLTVASETAPFLSAETPVYALRRFRWHRI